MTIIKRAYRRRRGIRGSVLVAIAAAMLAQAALAQDTVLRQGEPLQLRVKSEIRTQSRTEQMQWARSLFTFVTKKGLAPSKIVLIDSVTGEVFTEFQASELR